MLELQHVPVFQLCEADIVSNLMCCGMQQTLISDSRDLQATLKASYSISSSSVTCFWSTLCLLVLDHLLPARSRASDAWELLGGASTWFPG
jgi:hypothetical protein